MELQHQPRRQTILRRLTTLVAATMTACLLAVVGAAGANAAVIVGVCTLKVGDPHGSTHVSGTINTLSSITCTITMPEMHIQTWLYKAPSKYWPGDADSEVGVPAKKKLQSNRAVSCKEGPAKFRNRTYLQFRSPSGVNPAYHSNTYYSPWKSVACGLAFKATEAPSQLVDITVKSDGSVEFGDPYADTVA